MRIAVISSRYPDPENLYNHTFVHVRNKWYVECGNEVEVFVPSPVECRYTFDTIKVRKTPGKNIQKSLSRFDVIFIHLLYPYPFKHLDADFVYDYLIREKVPTVFFIHGIESERLADVYPFEFELTPKSVARFLFWDYYLIPKMAKIVRRFLKHNPNAVFVFPSNWIKNKSEETYKVKYQKRYKIIPNGIDTTLFSYNMNWENRSKILSIRPVIYRSTYGIDLLLNAAEKADPKLSFSLYGDGKNVKKVINHIQKRKLTDRFKLYQGFLKHDVIPSVHKKHGLYFAVTKSDTQGVSMCEAMASGLPVVSYNICAIPEFVKHGETGFLVNNENEACERLLELCENKNLYINFSESGRSFMESIDITITTKKELDLATELISRSC